MDTRHYGDGTWVVTRRGKRGQVVRGTGETVLVRFGGKEFEMNPTSVIYADVYDRMGKGYSRQQYQ